METQLRNLGQKYMGIRPNKHKEAMFRTQEIKPDGGHPVPVSVSTRKSASLETPTDRAVELLERTMYHSICSLRVFALTIAQTFPISLSALRHSSSRLFLILVARIVSLFKSADFNKKLICPSLGSLYSVQLHRMLPSQQVRLIQLKHLQIEWYIVRDSLRLWQPQRFCVSRHNDHW